MAVYDGELMNNNTKASIYTSIVYDCDRSELLNLKSFVEEKINLTRDQYENNHTETSPDPVFDNGYFENLLIDSLKDKDDYTKKPFSKIHLTETDYKNIFHCRYARLNPNSVKGYIDLIYDEHISKLGNSIKNVFVNLELDAQKNLEQKTILPVPHLPYDWDKFGIINKVDKILTRREKLDEVRAEYESNHDYRVKESKINGENLEKQTLEDKLSVEEDKYTNFKTSINNDELFPRSYTTDEIDHLIDLTLMTYRKLEKNDHKACYSYNPFIHGSMSKEEIHTMNDEMTKDQTERFENLRFFNSMVDIIGTKIIDEYKGNNICRPYITG